MHKRLNITLPQDVLVRADAFALRERYTRSGLIAAALDAFMERGARPVDPRAAQLAREPAVGHAVRPGAARPGALNCRSAVGALLGAFFAARDDIEAAWLFGSVARGEAVECSDVDVAILPRQCPSDEEGWRLELHLAARLERALEVGRVDVTLMPCDDSLLSHRALVEGVRVFGDSSTRAAELEIRAAGQYFDTKRLRRMLDARLGERVRGRG